MKPIDPQQLKPKAAEIFTDREAPRAAFWKVYHTMERGCIEIINYYGVGGIGKTSLLKQIRSELYAAGNHKHVEYSFENRKPKDRILFDLSRQLMKKCDGLRFPIFDYAFEKYQILCGEEQLGKHLLEKESVLDHHLVGSAFSVMGDYVPFVGTVSSVITESAKAVRKLAKKYEQVKGVNAEIYQEISALDVPNDLFGRLQYYFSLDAYPYFSRSEETAPLVVLLDGYEILVNRLQNGDKAAAEDLWLRGQGGLIPSIPNTIWVIAGREKLDWGESYIPQDHSHLIGNLAQTDAMQFFEASGISDPDLAAGLCALTDGTPVYMDLCVKQYQNYRAMHEGKMPGLSEFGQNTEEIAVRFLRDMSIMEQGILRLLSCLPNTWSDALVMELAQKMQYDFSMNEYRLIKEMTLIEAVCLLLAGMNVYDALIHAFGTAGTGGFSNYNASVGSFQNPLIEWIIAIFMMLFGVNFAMYFHMLRKEKEPILQSEELWFYLILVGSATLIITLVILPQYHGFFEALRTAFFQVNAIVSTTGFATADFNLWPLFARALLLLLLCFGACAGSTAGGFKLSRILLLFKTAYRDLEHTLQPRKVAVVRFEGKPVAESTLTQVGVYLSIWLFMAVVGTLLLSIRESDLVTAMTATLTCLSNVGPGLNKVGPAENFAFFSPAAKLLLSFLMLAGRLEIYPILLLFSPNVWRKN